MYFKRKAYDRLLDRKKNYADRYAVLLEGARRVGKSTIAENRLFLRLQAVTGKNLHKGESVVIFDEVQLYPKARQAVKHRLS